VTDIHLVDAAGSVSSVGLREAPGYTRPTTPLVSRIAYAAAHVVPRVTGDNTPGRPADIDWDATIDFRRHVWSWGLGVADAMDTAQRNMGLDAAATRELITRSARAAREEGGALVVGVNTDHIDDEVISLDAVIDAYKEQLHFSEDAGAGVVLMASRHLARAATSAADYLRVYREVLDAATTPVILHWLGAAFDPSLASYFGSTDSATASATVLEIITENAAHVSGIKMSLLDPFAEIALRGRLPETATMFTGDDFNYVGLIAGSGPSTSSGTGEASSGTGKASSGTGKASSGTGHSNALLGAFAALAPSASAAIQALDAGDRGEFESILGPTEDLSRQIFAAPTFYYKTGVAFLAWLNGHQSAFSMVGGLHSARSLPHLSEIVRLANRSGALERPELAAQRWHDLLRLDGVDVSTGASA
jgi:hypothetical protein